MGTKIAVRKAALTFLIAGSVCMVFEIIHCSSFQNKVYSLVASLNVPLPTKQEVKGSSTYL